MYNNKLYYFIVALFLFSSVSINVFAQSDSKERPLLTQQIDSGEIVIASGSIAALVPAAESVAPLVSAVDNLNNCAWYEVPCFQGPPPTSKCNCQFLYCSTGWTQGPCPNP